MFGISSKILYIIVGIVSIAFLLLIIQLFSADRHNAKLYKEIEAQKEVNINETENTINALSVGKTITNESDIDFDKRMYDYWRTEKSEVSGMQADGLKKPSHISGRREEGTTQETSIILPETNLLQGKSTFLLPTCAETINVYDALGTTLISVECLSWKERI